MRRLTSQDVPVLISCAVPLIGVAGFIFALSPNLFSVPYRSGFAAQVEIVLFVAAPVLVLLGPLVGLSLMLIRRRRYRPLWLSALPAALFVPAFLVAWSVSSEWTMAQSLVVAVLVGAVGAVIWMSVLVHWFLGPR